MDFKLLIGSIGLLFVTGCGCVNSVATEFEEEISTENNVKHTVYIQVTEYKPHCGGMAPTPEMEANMTQLASERVYYLYKGTRPTDENDFTKVMTNTEGLIEMEIPSGNYSMITEDKLLSTEEFLSLNKIEGSLYQNQPNSCYEQWRNSADFTVNLDSDTTLYLSINHRCFTGINPCVEYTGPPPP